MRFAYTIFCDSCGWKRHGEHEVTLKNFFFRADELRDLTIECPRCGPLELSVARRIPTSPRVERRQLAKPRTPLRGTPRRRV